MTSVPSHQGQPFRATCHHLALPAGSAPGCVPKAQAEQKPHPLLPTHTPPRTSPTPARSPALCSCPRLLLELAGLCQRFSITRPKPKALVENTKQSQVFVPLAPPSPGERRHRQQVSYCLLQSHSFHFPSSSSVAETESQTHLDICLSLLF